MNEGLGGLDRRLRRSAPVEAVHQAAGPVRDRGHRIAPPCVAEGAVALAIGVVLEQVQDRAALLQDPGGGLDVERFAQTEIARGDDAQLTTGAVQNLEDEVEAPVEMGAVLKGVAVVLDGVAERGGGDEAVEERLPEAVEDDDLHGGVRDPVEVGLGPGELGFQSFVLLAEGSVHEEDDRRRDGDLSELSGEVDDGSSQRDVSGEEIRGERVDFAHRKRLELEDVALVGEEGRAGIAGGLPIVDGLADDARSVEVGRERILRVVEERAAVCVAGGSGERVLDLQRAPDLQRLRAEVEPAFAVPGEQRRWEPVRGLELRPFESGQDPEAFLGDLAVQQIARVPAAVHREAEAVRSGARGEGDRELEDGVAGPEGPVDRHPDHPPIDGDVHLVEEGFVVPFQGLREGRAATDGEEQDELPHGRF